MEFSCRAETEAQCQEVMELTSGSFAVSGTVLLASRLSKGVFMRALVMGLVPRPPLAVGRGCLGFLIIDLSRGDPLLLYEASF